MAILTASGITFGDNSELNSRYGIVPLSSLTLFLQANAPTFWTRSTAHNDKALRVVSGTGGGSGGAIGFLSAFPASFKTFSASFGVSGAVGNTTLAWPQMPSHVHGNGGSRINYPQGAGTSAAANPATGGAGADQPHSHPWSGSASFNVGLDFRCQYVDVIVCSFTP